MSDGPSLLKVGHKFKGAMPNILNTITNIGIKYNKRYDRNFDGCFRCIAIALNGSKLIGYGVNKDKTHPFTKKLYHDNKYMTIHAEADLVMNLKKTEDINNVTDIIVIRGAKKLLNSHPCKICSGLFKMYFKKVRIWWFDANVNKWKVYMN